MSVTSSTTKTKHILVGRRRGTEWLDRLFVTQAKFRSAFQGSENPTVSRRLVLRACSNPSSMRVPAKPVPKGVLLCFVFCQMFGVFRRFVCFGHMGLPNFQAKKETASFELVGIGS